MVSDLYCVNVKNGIHGCISPLTNSYEKKSTAEMLLILTILNVISKQNTTNRVDKNDLV